MNVKTGQTIYEDILSLDADNNPLTGTTFDIVTTNNGAIYTGVTVDISLTDGTRGLYLASWSADTSGDYQIYLKNNLSNVIFISDIVNVLPDSAFDQTIYIGL